MQNPETRNPKTSHTRRFLWAIILLAVIARMASALYQGNDVAALPGVADQISYHKLSLRVLDGHGFSFDVGWWPATPAGQPTAHWSYLYVLFLTSVYSLFGPYPIAARVIQAVLAGILQPLLTWRIGRRLFGQKAGLISSAFSALYAYFVFYGGALMTESFYIVAILWALDIATLMTESPDRQTTATGPASWIRLGLAFGVAVLLRQVFLLIVPVFLLWLLWRLAYRTHVFSISQILKRSMIALAILIACIAPWTIRNYMAFDSFVLLNTNSGFAFFWGNHPIHGAKFVPILRETGYGSLIPSDVRELNEAAMDKALLLRGLDFVRKDPARYMLLSASRAEEYFRFWPKSNSGAMGSVARMLSFGLFFPLVLIGLCVLLFSFFRANGTGYFSTQQPGVALLLLTGGFYTLLHLMTWTLIRYRLPVDAILMPVAAIGTAAGLGLLKRILSRQSRGKRKNKRGLRQSQGTQFIAL